MKYFCAFILILAFLSCGEEKIHPKPPTYLRTEMPEPVYTRYTPDCPYSFELNEAYLIREVAIGEQTTCHRDINLGKLNGMIHFSYIDMEDDLATYINYANDKVDEHKVKATAIESVKMIRPEDRVYGTLFELKGNVASPFQFYLTDSTDRFVSGVVYFNSAPNYDSLKPSLDYLKRDIEKLMDSFKWK